MRFRFKLAWLIHSFKIPRFVKTPFLLSYLLTLILALLVLVFYFRIQPVVPMLYSLARPTQHLVPKEWLFLFPAISLLISVVHLFIVNASREYNQLIMKLFSWMTLVIQIMLSLSLIRILWIIS